MPVNISEFEVVVDPPPAAAPAASDANSAPAAPRGATPHEIEHILRREQERLARVQAH